MGKRSERRKRWRELQSKSSYEKGVVDNKENISQEGEETKDFSLIKKIYFKHYKKLMVIPIVLLLISIIIVITAIITRGEFIPMGVSLKGGLTLTIDTENSSILPDEIENFLKTKMSNDISIREITEFGVQKAVVIDVEILQKQTPEELESTLIDVLKEKYELKSYSVETIGPSLGASFFRQAISALIIAFFIISIVVFFFFKIFIPSIAIVLAAFSTIIGTIATVDVLGMKIGTAGIAAFLMLIGYSIDTDILLTTRVLKRTEGTVFDRVISAYKTGITMTLTTLVAVLIAFIFSQSEVMKEIMSVVLIGLCWDILNTWIQNTGIIRLYLEKRGRH